MKTQTDIASYVCSLRSRLHLKPEVRERILAETEAHLQDRAAAHVADGVDQCEAERLAVAEFGPAWRVALRFRLAYLDIRKALVWAGAFGIIAYKAYGTYRISVSPHRLWPWPVTIAYAVGDVAMWLTFGFIVTAIARRRVILGAALMSTAYCAFMWWMILGFSRPADYVVRHTWNGWQSGFYEHWSHVDPFYPPRNIILLRDSWMITGLVSSFAWTLIGVWAAGRIRARLAQRRSRAVV